MKRKLLLGYDIGSSSIKASLVDADTGATVATGSSPDREMKIESPQSGWAEQHPELWWQHVVAATRKMRAKLRDNSGEVAGIGISYQMHGLVMVDKNQKVLHPSIIWCDSRAVEIGNKAFADLGAEYCLGSCLNSPGNFTASKLRWVREHRPNVYSKISKIMLPGDYIAMRLSGDVRTTVTGLSEGIFWDFKKMSIAQEVVEYYQLDKAMLPEVVPTFGIQGHLTAKAAAELKLPRGIPIAYRAGDQPNNALSLNVLDPGEIAATAGTSGVIYGVTEKNLFDPHGRVNPFAHVNYSDKNPNKGILLCINGTGIQYSWIKQNLFDDRYTYPEMNKLASTAPVGSGGVRCFPYGNGAERSLENRDINCRFTGINFNSHGKGHIVRAAQEGIAFSFRYGLDIMKQIGMEVGRVRAGHSNLFQSAVFREAFVNTCGVDLEVYNTDGSQGAARGAGMGIGLFSSRKRAFRGLKQLKRLTPRKALSDRYIEVYEEWKNDLEGMIS